MMRQSLAGLLVAILAVGACAGEKTAEDRFVAINDALFKEAEEATTPKERQAVFNKYAPRFLAFAEKNAKHAMAFDALVLVLTLTGDGKITKDSPASKALAV